MHFLVRENGKATAVGSLGRSDRSSKRAFLPVVAVLALVIAVGWAGRADAQQRQNRRARQANKPMPTYRNVSYGPHERNVLDFWQADAGRTTAKKSGEGSGGGQTVSATPLVLFIHGGGFRNGSKEQINAATLRQLLEAGISVAAINYRLVSHAPLPAAHHDCRRALQFLRSKADEWNIDKTRVGAFGGSAGAQLCMYLAFHDEMADADSEDPIARESTRLTCVATNGGQTTMDIDWWRKHIPGYDNPHRNFFETFGVDNREAYLKKVADVSALSLISKGDVPIFMSYSMKPDDPVPDDPNRARGWKVHHVIFGVKLKEKMDALGIEAELRYPGARTKYRSVAHFFTEKLTNAKKLSERRPAAAQEPKAALKTNQSDRAAAERPVSPAQRVTRQFEKAAPKIGQRLPDVTAYDAEGKPWKLTGLRGHYAVLVFGCLT